MNLDGAEPVAYASLEDLLSAVADASLDQGLVPIENALEGTVSATIDGWSSITNWSFSKRSCCRSIFICWPDPG